MRKRSLSLDARSLGSVLDGPAEVVEFLAESVGGGEVAGLAGGLAVVGHLLDFRGDAVALVGLADGEDGVDAGEGVEGVLGGLAGAGVAVEESVELVEEVEEGGEGGGDVEVVVEGVAEGVELSCEDGCGLVESGVGEGGGLAEARGEGVEALDDGAGVVEGLEGEVEGKRRSMTLPLPSLYRGSSHGVEFCFDDNSYSAEVLWTYR